MAGFLSALGLGVILGWLLSRRFFARRFLDQNLALERAHSEARTDPLTALWNRKAFDEQLALLTAIARRYGQPLSVVLFDLDAFKRINDAYGHAAGDAALVRFAGVLRDSSRDSDFLARVGGDEFAILLPHTDSRGAGVLAERIRRSLESTRGRMPGGPQSATVPVIASGGIAEFVPEQTPADMVERADRALYSAKHAGGGVVVTSERGVPAGQRSSESSTR
jgi:diguanylate cyclase (GGDEF)-like protein